MRLVRNGDEDIHYPILFLSSSLLYALVNFSPRTQFLIRSRVGRNEVCHWRSDTRTTLAARHLWLRES